MLCTLNIEWYIILMSCQLKKMHIENCSPFCSRDLTVAWGDSLGLSSEESSKKMGGMPVFMPFWWRTRNWRIHTQTLCSGETGNPRDFSAFQTMERCKNQIYKKVFPWNITKNMFCLFFRAQSASQFFILNSFQGGLEVSNCSG